MPTSSHRPKPASYAWLLVLPLALVELVGSLVVRARVPAEGEWQEAAAHVAAELGPGDAVVAAPRWVDPLVREALGEVLGDRFDAALAAPPGLEGRTRLFVISARGHDAFAESTSDAAARARAIVEAGTLEELRYFGRVRVQRYRLEEPPIRYDFVAHLGDATVTMGERACARTAGRGSGRGLGEGPVLGPERFGCGGGDDRSVASTVIEDLALSPRHCISHRATSPPIAVTFPAAPLGERLVLHAGVHWVTERSRDGTRVTLRARVGDVRLGELVHADGDGWATTELEVPPSLRGERDVTFEVEGALGHPFCWAARSLGGDR